MPEKEHKFTLMTRDGCKRIFFLCLALIFVFSLLAQLLHSNFGSIKIERIILDKRGAELNGELYYPAGTSSEDSLPGVVVTHGGGCNFGVTRGIASELARRGFVVFNVSAYGSGASSMPRFDENGNGEDGLVVFMSPMGLLDAVDYLRSLTFVDPTRVGLIGHSMGAGRTATTALTDCGYLTFNDIMINVLADQFDQTFTLEEISQNADTLAGQRLDAGQLALYEYIREEKLQEYDTRLHAVILMGLEFVPLYAQTVTVAGHEVLRNVNCNVGYFAGDYDCFWNFNALPETKASWYSPDEDLALDTWYSLDDINGQSTAVGTLFGTSVADDEALQQAIDQRAARIIALTANETHSKEFFSTQMTTLITRYFEQTLGYNNGNLGDANATPIDAHSNMWQWRQACNGISMFAMFGMVLSLAGILFSTKFFSPCVVGMGNAQRPVLDGKERWAANGATVVFGFLAIYLALGPTGLNAATAASPNAVFPLATIAYMTFALLLILAIASLIILAYFGVIGKKKKGNTGFEVLHWKVSWSRAWKTIVVAVLLIAAAYGSLAFIDYFFGQDYRAWMTIFTQMKADYWFIALRYAVPYFVLYLVIGAAINYTTRSDIPAWKDDLIAVVVNSLGIWLCALINYLIVFINGYQGTFFCNFFISYQVLLVVPVTVFISRKLYRMTNSIWAGAAVNALLVSWSLASAVGVGDVYIAQTWLGNFLNF